MRSAILKATLVFVVLYMISLQTSMAGMEIFGWASSAFGIALLFFPGKLSGSPIERLKKIYIPSVDVSLLALFAVIVAGVLIFSPAGIDRGFAIGTSRWIVLFFFMRLALAHFDFRNAEPILRTVIVLTGLIGVYCIYQYFTGQDLIRGARNGLALHGIRANGEPYYRVEGMYSLPTTFAHSMAQWACLPLAYYFVNDKDDGSKFKWVALVCGIFASNAIVMSLTRGAWISFPCAVLVMGFLGRPRWLKKAIVGLVVGLICIYLFVPEIFDRSATIAQTTGNQSNSERIELWKANWTIFQDYPVLGIGYGVNENVMAEYLQKVGAVAAVGGNAHNTYLQFLAGTGFVGFALYMIFVGSLMYFSYRLFKRVPREKVLLRAMILGAIGAQVATHLGGLTDCNFKDAEVNHPFIFVLACVATLWARSKNASDVDEAMRPIA